LENLTAVPLTPAQIQTQSQQLAELWKTLIDGNPPIRNLRTWLLDCDQPSIESAIRVCSRFICRQPDPEAVDTKRKIKYVNGTLVKSRFNQMTPEEREAELSAKRAAAGERGAYEKWRKEKLELSQSLLSVCHPLPAIASGCRSSSGGDSGSDSERGSDGTENKTVAPPARPSLSSSSSTATPEPRGSAPNPATGASRPPDPLGGMDSAAPKNQAARAPIEELDEMSQSGDDIRARRKDAEELAGILHEYYAARPEVTIPPNWKKLWTGDLLLTLAHISREDLEHAMEGADYESQREYNVTCKGFLRHFSVALDKWKKANKVKAGA
jgi:hypothetical protein